MTAVGRTLPYLVMLASDFAPVVNGEFRGKPGHPEKRIKLSRRHSENFTRASPHGGQLVSVRNNRQRLQLHSHVRLAPAAWQVFILKTTDLRLT
jgi:hypothetical protein